jgi:hypothetical protein
MWSLKRFTLGISHQIQTGNLFHDKSIYFCNRVNAALYANIGQPEGGAAGAPVVGGNIWPRRVRPPKGGLPVL